MFKVCSVTNQNQGGFYVTSEYIATESRTRSINHATTTCRTQLYNEINYKRILKFNFLFYRVILFLLLIKLSNVNGENIMTSRRICKPIIGKTYERVCNALYSRYLIRAYSDQWTYAGEPYVIWQHAEGYFLSFNSNALQLCDTITVDDLTSFKCEQKCKKDCVRGKPTEVTQLVMLTSFMQCFNIEMDLTRALFNHCKRNSKDQYKIGNITAYHYYPTLSITMKLYSVNDGPPSIAVRMALKALKIPHELINIDYIASEHMTEEYAKLNPQKEIPVLDDNGFYLSESIAIMQYLCDKYAPDNELYPKDPVKRAVVNQRLCFNMAFYYSSIGAHSMFPIFFDAERDEMSLKKTNNALSVFETYLQRAGTKYAAADHLTIADFGLVAATLCLEAIEFDLSPYPMVSAWYANFKSEYPELWAVAKEGMDEIAGFEKNRPDLSHMNHPFYPTRKPKA